MVLTNSNFKIIGLHENNLGQSYFVILQNEALIAWWSKAEMMKSWYKADIVDLRSRLLVEFTAQVDCFGDHQSGRLHFQR